MVGNRAATDDILVHARAADFLAHAVDDEQINRIYRDPRKQSLGFFQQLVFNGFNIRSGYGTNDLGLIPLVFHDGHTEGPRASFQVLSGHRQQHRMVSLSNHAPPSWFMTSMPSVPVRQRKARFGAGDHE